MAKLIFHPDAIIEIREAAKHYETSREGLGRAFLDAVDSTIERLQRSPLAWRIINGRFRRVLFDKFPYGVIYAIEDDVIYVVAVMHLKRKPGYWKNRLHDAD